jgi:amidohydrolase
MARLIGNKPGKVLALRADMDALPITELNNCSYASQNAGIMHACGHDGHVASLLGVDYILSRHKDLICGEVRLLFQHAEELPPGGAQEMVDAGVLDGVDMILGIHLWSFMPYGKVGIVSGAMMAAPDIFNLKILGKGGHGGLPHQAIDTITIGAQVVTNLQQIVARQINPLEPVVLSVTKFISGTIHNILPHSADIAGTVRTFDDNTRRSIPELMERIIKGVTAAHGAEYIFNYIYGYNPVINNSEVANFIEDVVNEVLGKEWVDKIEPSMAGEDFSAFLAKVPGCFIFVGAGNKAKGIIYPHHHPQFDIDEDALAVSMQIFMGSIAKLVM